MSTEQPLDITLKHLFCIVSRTTWSLRDRDRDEVMQSLCHYLEEKMDISCSDMRKIMNELGMTMREYCTECNEVIEEEGLCKECEESHPWVRTCPNCNKRIDAPPDKKFEKGEIYKCRDCN